MHVGVSELPVGFVRTKCSYYEIGYYIADFTTFAT